MTEPTTLTVRLGDGERVRREAGDRIRDLERGESAEDRHVLVLDDAEALQRLFRPTTLDLLTAIREHEPDSMREAAALVDRDFKEVHRNLTELEALGVVELAADGRSKRPIVRFDEIDVEVSLSGGESDVAPP